MTTIIFYNNFILSCFRGQFFPDRVNYAEKGVKVLSRPMQQNKC